MSIDSVDIGDVDMFQSLFSWNLLLMEDTSKGWMERFWFQSLFSWNLLLMATGDGLIDTDQKKFQSLFSWNLLLMPGTDAMPASEKAGFNPCFRGTCS